MIYRRAWPTRHELEMELFSVIEGFCNHTRRPARTRTSPFLEMWTIRAKLSTFAAARLTVSLLTGLFADWCWPDLLRVAS
jgi:hypothetical protein